MSDTEAKVSITADASGVAPSVDKAVKHLSFSLENSNPRVDPFGIGYDQLGNPTVKVSGYEITDSK